jgi:integrase/recombinase XerD
MFLSKGEKGVYYLYFINPLSGKRNRVSTLKKTKHEARQFERDFKVSDYVNSKSEQRSQAPKYLLELYKEFISYAQVNLTHSTVQLYEMSFKDFIKIVGNKPLQQLSIRDIEYFKSVRNNVVSKTTINIQIRCLKAAFNHAIRIELIEKNPFKGVKQFALPQKEKLAFTNEELQSLFEVITDNIIRRIVLFGLYTGCRLSEILNLQIKDLDFSKKVLIIRNKPDFKTKTGKIRQIPISESLQKLINASIYQNESNYLFSFDGIKRLNKDFVSQKFKKYLRKAELPEKYHFHCLRHTFITNLIKNGVPINFVKELAGHTEIQTTMGYVHIEVEDLRNAVNLINIAV